MWNLTDIKEWIIDTKDTIVWKWQDLSKANKIAAVGILALAIWVICTLIYPSLRVGTSVPTKED